MSENQSLPFEQRANQTLAFLRESGQYKQLQAIASPMDATVRLDDGREAVVLCSNNYLGLSNHPQVIEAGIEGLKTYGAGTASVRFICGTLKCHQEIETAIARFVGTPAALTYVSCWNANEAFFPTVAGEDDVFLSDELNHASIIDACRQAKKTARAIYRHNDLDDLESKLKEYSGKATRWVITDGVFSMEGDVAPLDELSRLCNEYSALLVVDDSHGVGVLGARGRGTPEEFGLLGQVDVLTGTLGKALGGAAGGYVAANQTVCDLLTQRSRPALFSNALPATVACSARRAIEIIEAEPQRVEKLRYNTKAIRHGLRNLGFECADSKTAIIPIHIGDTAEAIAKSRRLMELGVWVVGFGFPVVPQGAARLRVQVSAALEAEHIERALEAFGKL